MSTKDRKSLLIMDGVALQGALRAALAVAPSSGETACVWLQVRQRAEPEVFACAHDPKNHIVLAARVGVESVDLAVDSDDRIIVSIPTVRELLAMKVKKPRDGEPWPSVAWEMTEDRITQSDASVIFGRVFKVKREAPGVFETSDVPGQIDQRFQGGSDALVRREHVPLAALAPAQVKRIGAAMANVGAASAQIVALPPGDNQLSCAWLRAPELNLLAWIVDSDAPASPKPSHDDAQPLMQPASAKPEDVEVVLSAAAKRVVVASPPSGVA